MGRALHMADSNSMPTGAVREATRTSAQVGDASFVFSDDARVLCRRVFVVRCSLSVVRRLSFNV